MNCPRRRDQGHRKEDTLRPLQVEIIRVGSILLIPIEIIISTREALEYIGKAPSRATAFRTLEDVHILNKQN